MVVRGGGWWWWESPGDHGRPQRQVPRTDFGPAARIWSSNNAAKTLLLLLFENIQVLRQKRGQVNNICCLFDESPEGVFTKAIMDSFVIIPRHL